MKQSKPNKTANVQLRDIRTNGATQMREGIDDEHLERLMHAIDEGVDLPPLDVFEDDRNIMWLADGFHRYEAMKRRGIGAASVQIWYGSKRDAIIFAAGANADHGLPRTNADKRRAVKALLLDKEWKGKSDREIARQARVHHETVASVKAELNPSAAKNGACHNGEIATRQADRSVLPKDDQTDFAKPSNDFATPPDRGPVIEEPEPFEAATPDEPRPEPEAELDDVDKAIATKSWAQSFKLAMSRLFDDYLNACRGPGGAWYGGRRTAIESAFDQIKGEIDAAIPHAVCPYCEGDGCDKCRHTGVMPKLVWQNATNTLNRFGKATT